MGRRPRKRRHRHPGAASCEGPDRFSHLNEDLLRSILNCLPTRSAARLGALSRHFRNEVPRLLERVDSLTLHEPHLPHPLRITPPLLIRRLALAPYRAISPSSFGPIIDDAGRHGLSELSFSLTRRARLPKNVLTVKSLVVLSLDTCAVPPWSDVSCPCLRTLRLHRVAIHQQNISRILASASCLETLEMEYCTGHGTGRGGGCTLESSSVRNLVFKPTLKQAGTTIRASGLRDLTLYTRSRANSLELAPAPEIRKVYLHISKSKAMMKSMESFRIRPFLDAAMKLECLTLRGHAMKAMTSDLPRFIDLKDRLASISCLTTSLVQFKFLGFKPQEYQELVVYLLTEAKQLKKVGVEFDKRELASVKQILSVRRATTEKISTKYKKNYYMELEY